MKEKLVLYILASQLAFQDSTKENKTNLPYDYKYVNSIHEESGLDATYYKNKNGDIVIAFAGSNTIKDKGSLLNFVHNTLPKQALEAIDWYYKIQAENPDSKITVTGGSLGGSLAQIVAATTGCDAVTLNPYDCKNVLEKLGLDSNASYENIENYRASNDILFALQNLNASNCIGKTYIVPTIGVGPIAAHQNIMLLCEKTPIPFDNWKRMPKIGIFDKILNYFSEAQTTQPIVIDPLLVDLNGDGIKTTSVENGIYFDHQSDGFMETSAWVDENDGVLVIDKNNDGVIDNGNEIFGDNYVKADGNIATSGFDALADLDSNGDGVINSNDERFNEIKVLKGDGTLLTLEEAGVTSINLSLSNRKNTANNLIYKWAGVEGIEQTSRGSEIDARKLTALEKFMGEGFIGVDRTNNPNNQAANILEAAFTSLVLRLGLNPTDLIAA